MAALGLVFYTLTQGGQFLTLKHLEAVTFSRLLNLSSLLVALFSIVALHEVPSRLQLAVVNTALAFTVWNPSLQELSAVESSMINNTMLVQITVLAWLFLGEAPCTRQAAGLALAAAGICLAHVTPIPRKP